MKIATTFFSWLAIVIVVLLFSLALVNDLSRLFFLLREKIYLNHDKKSYLKKPELLELEELSFDNESVFKKVTRKEVEFFHRSLSNAKIK